jgi:Dyp-type peroxidase family
LTLDSFDIGFPEHFGFRDGVSQPTIAGTRPDIPGQHSIAAGEFVLGYVNEHGQYTDSPLLEPSADPGRLLGDDVRGSGKRDFGRNGSYLVVRQLSQDVPAFWGYVDEQTRTPDGTTDVPAQTKLAAQMIGRWPSGAALALSPDQDRPELAEANDFGYAEQDAHGLRCPVGAHVRRTNPRDSLPPEPGTDKSIAVNKRHRLLRRGREYGLPMPRDPVTGALTPPDGDDAAGRGLHFLCLCANIARQFEFVQHTWALNPNFAGLYDDADPVLAGHLEQGRTFTVQARPVRRRVKDVPAFVTVRGGAYFFLPGVRALRYLAALDASARSDA